ncbi:transcription-silencing protein Clr2-domain-containing protein [Bisporella sp. PMI_857]|nr:transcription-silencing protein Clr2-domain-containing protein [Bisporella sp. PMI_857]
MAPIDYYFIKICRSDGLSRTWVKGKWEANEPTAEQQSQAPNDKGIVEYYRKVPIDDPKHYEWRKKIGGMAKDYMGSSRLPADKNFILEEFPQDYVLWEQIKYKVDKTDKAEKTKTSHAAGGNERQDAYLYGHRGGRTKRYRSPADFFAHCLFLSSPWTENDHCTCKLCSPAPKEEISVDAGVGVKREMDSTPKEKEGNSEQQPKPNSQGNISQTNVISSRPISQPNLGAQASKLANQGSSIVKSAEQIQDADPSSKFLYRPGELIWFNRGTRWGLSVISKRQIYQGKARYLAQPLSHPLAYQPSEIKENEEDIRPWLAWSLPAVPQQLQGLTFDQVPWDRAVRGELGQLGDCQVHASIISAKAIDGSYSLFDRIDNLLAAPNEVYYTGMFLGAEKIWVGEPVRLHPSVSTGNVNMTDIEVLVIDKMIERTTTTPPSSIVTFIGDVYKFVEMPNPYKSRAEWPTPNLPARMVTDLRFRNEVADNASKGIYYEWRLLETAAKRGMNDIKGRWYETRTLLPILRGRQTFNQDIFRGIAADTGLFMNSRGDNSDGVNLRKKNRKDTLGRAVPDDFKVSRGLDGNPADDLFPDAQMPKLDGDLSQYVDYGA